MPPDFLGIGAQKAGTTWLYRNFRRHPGLWLPPVKELHYFDLYHQVGDRGRVAYLRHMLRGDDGFARRWRDLATTAVRRNLRPPRFQSLRWDLDYFLGLPSDGWYAELFDHAPDGTLAGEITPAYSSLGEKQVARIHRVAPDARILFLMRNPVERAWSHAVMELRRFGASDPLAVPVDEVRRHLDAPPNVRRTGYRRILRHWTRAYGADRLFVGFMEDVQQRPGLLLRRIYDFLGLPGGLPHEPIRERVFSKTAGAIPAVHARHLAEQYADDLEWLAEHVGGYATAWAQIGERLRAASDDDGLLPYPFMGSPLWPDASLSVEQGGDPSVQGDVWSRLAARPTPPEGAGQGA